MTQGVTKIGEVWHIRWSETGPDGKRIHRQKSCKGMSKREAVTELARVQMELEPLPSVTIYRDGVAEVISGMDPQLAERYRDCDLLLPARMPFIEIREGDLGSGVQALYTHTRNSGQLLIWQRSLDLDARSAVLGVEYIPRGRWE